VAETSDGNGLELIEADNVNQALSTLQAEVAVKAMLTDVHMPGFINGSKQSPPYLIVKASEHRRRQSAWLRSGYQDQRLQALIGIAGGGNQSFLPSP
jgi:hypothetical protein